MSARNQRSRKADITETGSLMTGSVALFLLIVLLSVIPGVWAQEAGVTNTTIRIGSVMDLEGDTSVIGKGAKRGIEAALKDQLVQQRKIEFLVVNDFYEPAKTVEAANQLINKGIFLMLGNTGTPTTKAVLPVLAENKVPAVGFYTGAGFTGPGEVLNFRASYAQEVASAVEAVLSAGVKPNEVCAYVQNDGYGMAGLQGFKTALAKQPNTQEVIAKLDQVLAMQGENPARNNIGPVGVYQRSTLRSREGYQSLKNWEATTGNRCRFVATVAVYDPAAKFIGYARYKGENWVFSSPSIAAGNALKSRLKEYNVTDKVIVTQVVPALDSPLPIVKDAHAALGENLDYAALEGYLVGRMFLAIMRNITGDITRENFLKAARRQPYDMGGARVDFTTDNQGSDFVLLTYLNGDTYQVVNPDDLRRVFQQ